jgi:hypothetical protein
LPYDYHTCPRELLQVLRCKPRLAHKLGFESR